MALIYTCGYLLRLLNAFRQHVLFRIALKALIEFGIRTALYFVQAAVHVHGICKGFYGTASDAGSAVTDGL